MRKSKKTYLYLIAVATFIFLYLAFLSNGKLVSHEKGNQTIFLNSINEYVKEICNSKMENISNNSDCNTYFSSDRFDSQLLVTSEYLCQNTNCNDFIEEISNNISGKHKIISLLDQFEKKIIEIDAGNMDLILGNKELRSILILNREKWN